MSANAKRVGRPRGSDGEETRRRLLDAAKAVFAERGYKDASNKLIAERAAVSPATIYLYFLTKQALFLEVHEALQGQQLRDLEPVARNASSLADALDEILELLANGRASDPHSNAFFSVVRMEARRNEEISGALDAKRWTTIFNDLAALGVKTGEIAKEDEEKVKAVFSVFLLGVAQHAAEASSRAHQNAINGLRLLLKGALVKPARR